MDDVATEKSGGTEEEEGWALQGQAQVNMALGTPCSGPVGLET